LDLNASKEVLESLSDQVRYYSTYSR